MTPFAVLDWMLVLLFAVLIVSGCVIVVAVAVDIVRTLNE